MIFFPVNKGTFSMRIIETYLRRLKTPLLRPILLALHESTFPPSRACKIQTVETRIECSDPKEAAAQEAHSCRAWPHTCCAIDAEVACGRLPA